MKEQERHEQQQWDHEAMSQALGSADAPTMHDLYGQGHRYSVETTQLELYPAAGVVRVTTPDLQLTLASPSSLLLGKGEILLEKETEDYSLWLALDHTGQVIFSTTKHEPEGPEASQEPSSLRERSTIVDGVEAVIVANPGATQAVLDEPILTPPQAGKKAEAKERPNCVKLQGTIRHNPKYVDPKSDDPTSDKPPYLRFRLQQGQGEQAVVHKVFTTRERAVHYKEQFAAGDTVSVVGIVQETEHKHWDGTVTTDRSIYALAIKRVGPKDAPSAQA